MPAPGSSSSHPSSAEDRAAAWFARRRSGRWSGADEEGFTAWLREDPAHAEAWRALGRTWERLEGVRDQPALLVLRESALHRARRGRFVDARGLVAGLAAALVVGSGLWWSFESSRTAQLAVTALHPPQASPAGTGAVHDASTGIGERFVLQLEDGSKVTLNTASAVHADESGTERRVTLIHGEAFFDVAKDPTRPFVVTVGSRRVVAVGTAFAVRLDDRQVRVTLVEGRVRVLPSAAGDNAPGAGAARAVMLEAGSALTTRADGSERVQRLDAERATSWRTGKLVFDGERLADVVAEMNRYSVEKLVLGSPALGARRVSGVFDSTGGPAFAQALEAYGIAHATRSSPTTIVLEPGDRDQPAG